MATCSVRAAKVYGPEDDSLVPGIVSRAKDGAGQVGDGSNMVDFVFAGNVAHAILLAAQGLSASASAGGVETRDASVAGRAFFVTDSEPVPYGDFAQGVLSGLGYKPSNSWLPLWLASLLAAVFRLLAMLLSPVLTFRPKLTERRVAEEGRTQRFDISIAKRVLGYHPLWSQAVRTW